MKKNISAGIVALFLASSQFDTIAAMSFSNITGQVADVHSPGQTRMDPPIPDPDCTSPPGQPCKPARP